MLVNYAWAQGLPWNMADLHDTQLEETDFSFASGYQLQLTFWLVFGPLVHSAVSIPENERTLAESVQEEVSI